MNYNMPESLKWTEFKIETRDIIQDPMMTPKQKHAKSSKQTLRSLFLDQTNGQKLNKI